jgi:hypothetical protein
VIFLCIVQGHVVCLVLFKSLPSTTEGFGQCHCRSEALAVQAGDDAHMVGRQVPDGEAWELPAKPRYN